MILLKEEEIMDAMKRIIVVISMLVLSACGGGGGGFFLPPSPGETGIIAGKVSNNSTGAPIASATVAVGTLSTTTANDGTYTLANVPVGAGKVVSITKTGFAAGSIIVTVVNGATTTADLALLPDTGGTGTITGKVSNNSTGAPIATATVAVGTISTTTAGDGTYTLANVPAGAGNVVSITKAGFAAGSKIATVVAVASTTVDAALLPVFYSTNFDPTTSQTITVTGSTAKVVLGANALKTASGAVPAAPVTVNITPIDPSSNPQIMPGNYATSAGGFMESFGAIEVNFKDSAGAALNLASGQTATIRIPLAAGAISPPATIDAFYFNATTGLWVKEGTLTLAGVAPNRYYEGTVTHFTYWNADRVYETTCLTGRVVSSTDVPVKGARVEAQGRNYIGTSETYTLGDGTFNILVRANSTVIISARTSALQSQSLSVTTSAAGNVCSALPANLKLGGSGTGSAGSAKITLTWGANPSDLDSHLTGPTTAGSRFHVYFVNKGSLTASPFANLDVDNTDNFGPEVVTVSKFVPGTYRYSVHHYDGSGTIFTSPARVELTLGNSTTIYTPPNPGTVQIGVDTVWQVFELVVSSTGAVTVNPLGTYQRNIPADGVSKQVIGSYDEYLLFQNLPSK
jgi:hypothetical protein